MTDTLRMTTGMMRAVIRACREGQQNEVCGLLLAEKETPLIASRIRLIANVDEDPEHGYTMDPDEQKDAYKDFDRLGLEPLAVFHSHVTSAALPSDVDKRKALDASVLYLIVSMVDLTATAWRMEQYVGNTVATKVPLVIVPDPKAPPPPAPPMGPWALTEGNRVRIQYQRYGKSAMSTCVATVLGIDGGQVRLDPLHKNHARSIQLDRIRGVHVLEESERAEKVRREARNLAMNTTCRLETHGVQAVAGMVQVLHILFPPTMTITVEGSL